MLTDADGEGEGGRQDLLLTLMRANLKAQRQSSRLDGSKVNGMSRLE